MEQLDDRALLRQYVEEQSDDAFATLVTRHINLVYTVALRQTGSPESAEEITQAVFIILARKAAQLRDDKALSSWLFQTTRLTSNNFLRSEMRRRNREQEAYMQSVLEQPEDDLWPKIAPLLDNAVGSLREKDRRAILLRFYEQKNLREVGNALGTGEDAAEKRVSRALEKLRRIFAKRGVRSTTAIISEKISMHSVQAAPAVLAKTVTLAAAAKGATASVSTLTLIKGATKIMAWTKVKAMIGIGAGVLLAAGLAITAVREVKANEIYPWQVPKADFSVLYKVQPDVKIVPTKFVQGGGRCTDGSRGAMGIAQPLDVIIRVAYQESESSTLMNIEVPEGRYDFIAKLVPAQEENKKMPIDKGWTVALQNEIERQFGIKGTYETRDTEVLVLRPVSTGARGFKVSHSMPSGQANGLKRIAIGAKGGNRTFFEQPIGTLTYILEQNFKTPIVDKTGLTEKYDFAIKWDQPDPKQPNLDGLTQALTDQLGLELVRTNMPMRMLVIQKVK